MQGRSNNAARYVHGRWLNPNVFYAMHTLEWLRAQGEDQQGVPIWEEHAPETLNPKP